MWLSSLPSIFEFQNEFCLIWSVRVMMRSKSELKFFA